MPKYVGENFEWTIRPELVKAITELNFLKRTYEMEYFILTKENVTLLKNDIGEKYDSNKKGTKIYFDTRKKLRYLGDLLSNELGLDFVNNYNEKPNKQAGQGKGFVLKEYILAGFIPSQYHNLVSSNLFIKISFWGFDSGNPHFGVDIDVNFSNNHNIYNTQRDLFQQQNWAIPINQFPSNWDDLLKLVKPEFKRLTDYINSYFLNDEKMKEIKNYIDLLST